MCYFRYVLFLVSFLYYLSISAEAKVTTILSSNHIVTGEINYITFIIDAPPEKLIQPLIDVPEATINLYSTQSYRQQGKLYCQLTYKFKPTNKGTYTIPATAFSIDEVSKPLTITVNQQSSLEKQVIQSTTLNQPDGSNFSRKTYPYYTQLAVIKPSLFPNEATQLEYKIYLPQEINIAQWGLPTGPKENATAWRFETPRARSLNGSVIIDGIKFQVGTFYTTVSGIKPGLAKIGPFKNRIVHNIPILTSSGYRVEAQKIHIESGSIQLNIRDLPPNPPENFKGDVGHYSMSIDIESKTEISSSESIKAKVTLNGKGKLYELSPPSLTEDEHWKIISKSKRELGQNRKRTEGIAEFDYLIQPRNTGPAKTTPGFTFSFLDPDLEAYTTIAYPGVPITINLTSNSINNSSDLLAKSNQMLGIIQQIKTDEKNWFQSLPQKTIHIIPALICLYLFFIFLKRKYRAYQFGRSHKVMQLSTLKEMSDQHDEDFLKAASNYIQRWVDVEQHPELKEIQEFRDGHCYKPDSPVKISTKRKQSIIDSLKKLMILLICFTPFYADASAHHHYENGNFQNALKEYQTQQDQLQDQSSDLLYNIGNCYQKLNQPAQAAIHYHRALQINPYHTQSLHNLAIIQQSNNSFIRNNFVKKDSIEYWISYVPQSVYSTIIILSLWSIVISVLWVLIMKPSYKIKVILIYNFLTLIGLTAMSSFAYYTHLDTQKTPPDTFAILSTKSNLLEQPTDSSEIKIEIQTASECRIISTSGTYSYIELADIQKTQGWILTKQLLKLENK